MFRLLVVVLAMALGAAPAFADNVSIVVDLSNQSMVVSVDGQQQYDWAVSSGKRGYRTPTGSYAPIRMHRRHFSHKYNNAPMPYSIFFSGGYAIHGTSSVSALGSPASHGCVRLSVEHAQMLYELVQQYGTDNTDIRIRS